MGTTITKDQISEYRREVEAILRNAKLNGEPRYTESDIEDFLDAWCTDNNIRDNIRANATAKNLASRIIGWN